MYEECVSCGIYIDDGLHKEEGYLCHDCLDKD